MKSFARAGLLNDATSRLLLPKQHRLRIEQSDIFVIKSIEDFDTSYMYHKSPSYCKHC